MRLDCGAFRLQNLILGQAARVLYMMAICANGPLHICAPMVSGLPPPGKAHAAQGGKITTPGARHRTKGATDPLDATPSGHAGESELFGAAQEVGLASASLLIQDRNNRHGPTLEC